jgi:prepilin-type N-terminal cleavage/methylation domain-containing protein
VRDAKPHRAQRTNLCLVCKPVVNKNQNTDPAFTLVELIIVMAVLTTLMAVVAPVLSRSFRQRNLEQEAARLLALTEYGRDEAVSQGVPAVVWIDPDKGIFGVETAAGYTASQIHEKQYALDPDLHFDLPRTNVLPDGRVQLVELMPDGSPDPSAAPYARIVDRNNNTAELQLAPDGWSYEIAKEPANANPKR